MTHAGDTEGSLPTTAAIRLVLGGLLERRPQLPAMRAGLLKSLAVLLALTMSLVACASRPPVVRKQLPSAVISHEREVLSAELVAQALGERARHAYKVGPGDTLVVAVYGHPELSLATYVGGGVPVQGNRVVGLVVDNDGTLQLPLVGSVQVEGKSSDELRRFLEAELTPYIKDPQVTVQVAFAGSIRYHLFGQFTSPGLKYSDRPLHLLEAMALAGSIQLDAASLRGAYVARGGRRLPVNFLRLIIEGDLRQNIPLESGDVVVVPDRQNEQVFVFGGASGSNPTGGVVQFRNGKLTLLQALASAGFGWKERYQGRFSETRVIRSEGDRAELFVVDAEAIIAGEAAPFEMAPGDVVFIPTTTLTDWNQALDQLLPTLQTISGVLNPFVQIKYLSED